MQTTAKIRAFLESLTDFRILPLETETGTGIAAQICGAEKGLEIMLRADIDALPQTEEYESPGSRGYPVSCIACGHDFHTASLLGAALSVCSVPKVTAFSGILWTWSSSRQKRERQVRVS